MSQSAAGHRILLTGATGQLGYELLQTLEPLGEIAAPTRAEMDLTDASSIQRIIRAVQPRWIINPAAYTAVDKAESEPDLACAINSEAIRIIGKMAQSIGAGVIHFSTDYVFDGSGTRPYQETDPTGPLSVYGATKLAGERALLESGAGHLVFRTSWVYGSHGKNFLRTILKLAADRESLRIVDDQHGGPTWSRDLARMTAVVIQHCESVVQRADLASVLAQLGGIYHAAGRGETSWYGFATEAVRLQQQRMPHLRFANIEPTSTAGYPTPAKRPANSRLNSEKLQQRFGWTMMDWRDSLREVITEL